METAGRAARAGAGHPASAQSASRGETENPDWSGGGNDMIWLTKEDLALTVPAERAAFRSPIPTQMVSNGEFMPARQTMQQRQVEERIKELADGLGGKLGLNRRKFLQTSCGMAAAFLAMDAGYGSVFTVDPAEAADPAAAAARLKALGHQFIFDDQVHFVRDDYTRERVLRLAEFAKNWNPVLKGEKITLQRYKFENFVKEIFMDSETKVALLSGAPFDDAEAWFLSNDQIERARALINDLAGSRRLLSHALFLPGQPRWVEEVDRAISDLKPDGWKGYTIGDPSNPSARYPYRLDDEKLMYPVYAKMERSGIRNVSIHKGLLPPTTSARSPPSGNTPPWTTSGRRPRTGRSSISSCTMPPTVRSSRRRSSPW